MAFPNYGIPGLIAGQGNQLANILGSIDPFKAYQEGQQFRSQQDTRAALKGGVPRGPDGTVDYGAMIDMLARAGNLDGIKTFAGLAEQSADKRFDRQYKGGMLDIARQQATRKDVPPQVQVLQAAGIDPRSPEGRKALFPKAEEKPLNPTEFKAVVDAEKVVESSNSVISTLKQAKELSKKAYGGPMAAQRGYLGSLVGMEEGIATEELRNMVSTNGVEQLKAIFGGNPTEGERKILLELQGSVDKPDAVRQKIFDRGIAAAEQRLKYNQALAERVRSRQFMQPQGQAAPAGAPQAAPPPQQQTPRLPPGTNPQQVLQEAQAAIQRGAPREAVIQRLQQLGIDISGL
jgi:hypothetical protein